MTCTPILQEKLEARPHLDAQYNPYISTAYIV